LTYKFIQSRYNFVYSIQESYSNIISDISLQFASKIEDFDAKCPEITDAAEFELESTAFVMVDLALTQLALLRLAHSPPLRTRQDLEKRYVRFL
jgi:hypothetical protein